jgi:hypothetical protein
MRTVGTAAALLLLCGTAMTQTASPAACAALGQLPVQGVAMTVTKTEWFPAGTTPPAGPGGGASAAKLPAYCRLDGVIDRRSARRVRHTASASRWHFLNFGTDDPFPGWGRLERLSITTSA